MLRQVAVIVASHDPADAGPFYRYVLDHVLGSDPKKATKASSQIRDVLMKSWTLIGIPPVIIATSALLKEEDKSYLGESELSEKW